MKNCDFISPLTCSRNVSDFITCYIFTENESTHEAKKAKYSEEEILSPRRSSRALVPNRKFKDMEMEWDITAGKCYNNHVHEQPNFKIYITNPPSQAKIGVEFLPDMRTKSDLFFNKKYLYHPITINIFALAFVCHVSTFDCLLISLISGTYGSIDLTS